VREVAALVEPHGQDGVARVEQRLVDRDVGVGPAMGLDVGVVGAEEGRQSAPGQVLDLVDDLVAAVVAASGIALGVLVGQHRPRGRQHRRRGEVLARDELQRRGLSIPLLVQQRGDLVVIGDPRAFSERGVTFAHSGEERPFPLDVVPRLIGAMEWDLSRAGSASACTPSKPSSPTSTVRAASSPNDVIPRSVVTSSPHFCRPAFAVDPPNGVRITVAGIDLVRDEVGDFRVLEDNVRIPSGVSYVIENRRAMTQTFASLFSTTACTRSTPIPAHLFAALREAAPPNVSDPVIVVLSPGVHNAAYFEHVLLARMMGVELVEGRDLLCRSNHTLHAHDERRATGPRDLPPRGRRVARSAAVPTGLDHRRRRTGELCARRATSSSPTGSATASPTTSSSTPTCRSSSVST
jgi:hypothetical protein